jgi:hypothetical protein
MDERAIMPDAWGLLLMKTLLAVLGITSILLGSAAGAETLSAPAPGAPSQKTTSVPTAVTTTVDGKPHKTLVFEGGCEAEAPAEPDEKGIAWDDWRNRMLRAAWQNWGNMLQGGVISTSFSRHHHVFADGTAAIFSCVVTKDRRIKDLQIVESSGLDEFDEMVLTSVRKLDGSRLLAFPASSQRDSIEQKCAFRIGTASAFHDHKFEDVEHAPGQNSGS